MVEVKTNKTIEEIEVNARKEDQKYINNETSDKTDFARYVDSIKLLDQRRMKEAKPTPIYCPKCHKDSWTPVIYGKLVREYQCRYCGYRLELKGRKLEHLETEKIEV